MSKPRMLAWTVIFRVVRGKFVKVAWDHVLASNPKQAIQAIQAKHKGASKPFTAMPSGALIKVGIEGCETIYGRTVDKENPADLDVVQRNGLAD